MALASVPLVSAAEPITAQAVAQSRATPMRARVRRWPWRRRSTDIWATTMTTVFAANASPSTRVDTPATSVAKPGKPAYIWP